MANLLEVKGSVIPIGTVIQAVGPPDSSWLRCDGSILAQASYPGYVAECDDLHPMMWKEWYFVDVDQSVIGTTKYAIDRMGDLIVCVGTGSTVWVSDDGGETWSTNTGLSANTHYCLANNGTRFVTADYNTSTAYYSTDGVTWNSATLPYSKAWRHLAYANGYFVLMHGAWESPTTYYAYSSDGITWYGGTAPFVGGYNDFVASDGSQFIVFGYSYDPYYKVHTSTNGSSWSSGTEDFFFGSPDYQDYVPAGIYYINGEYYMTWGTQNSFWYTQFIGSDLKDPADWKLFLSQPMGTVPYMKINQMIWTGNHIIAPNNYSSGDNMLVGPSMDNLVSFRTQMGKVVGIVNDGEDYAVVLPTVRNWTSVGRSVGISSYDRATHFQLPLEVIPDFNRISSYIKVAE